MLTDKEQDQYAALAAGIKIDHYRGDVAMVKRINSRGGEELVAWRPRHDDGDALRLAVTLNIFVEQWLDEDGQGSYTACSDGILENHGDDPFAATRRCIYRSAVEIGKRLE